MKINTYTLKYATQRELEMELNYQVASARVRSDPAFAVVPEGSSGEEKAIQAASKILRALKRQGRIQLFEIASALSEARTVEAVYLINKYPDIVELVGSEPGAIIIKL